MNLERDLQLLYELGTLRNIPRAWVQVMGKDVANLAEHHFRVAWIALLLAKHENAGDHEKILKMALVHDIPESRTGDTHYISRLYTQRDEKSAMHDIFSDTALGEDMIEIHEEYEKKESIEAKIVKDADNLDVDIELHEFAFKGDRIEDEFYPMREKNIYPRFYTESAKKIWKAIKDSNPHDWHIKAKNRHTAGDWSKPVE